MRINAMSTQQFVRGIICAFAAVVLNGCAATFSDDGGFETASTAAREHLDQEARWLKSEEDLTRVRDEVAKLLAGPLTVDDAVQVALFNNPGLQAAYSELGISEADRVQAGRLPNPGFHFGRTSGGGAVEIERALSLSIGAILTLPLRLSIETQRFESAKIRAAVDTLDVALTAREAYFKAVAASQLSLYMQQVLDAADASRELMRRMSRVGSSSKLALAREQLFHADATNQFAQAVQNKVAAREALVRALGLFGDQLNFTLPDRLPDLPKNPSSVDDIEATALTQRLDLKLARRQLASLKTSLNITGATHFVSLLEEGGPAQVRERGEAVQDGYEIAIEIPVFDFGDARVARAKAVYMQGFYRLRQTAINARSEVRETYHRYRTAFDVAEQYRDRIVPLRARISDEQLLRYNGMLTGVFELIQDAREQVVSVSQAVQAARDFWLADTALKRASLGAGSPGSGMLDMAIAGDGGDAEAH